MGVVSGLDWCVVVSVDGSQSVGARTTICVESVFL
jgi:hypothetical protein